MEHAIGRVETDQYKITFFIGLEGGSITLYNKDLDESWTMDYEDAQVIMPTVTMLIYSETMREEFKNA